MAPAAHSDARLRDGSTVVIIGGGPAGSACAIRLLRGARSRGLALRVLIFEGKDFRVHANQCVGVLSPPVEEVLADDLDVHLPRSLIKRQIFGYRLHGARENILLTGHGATAGDARPTRATYDGAPARGAYGHRYALVGDSTGWLRPFKGKGINTAVATGARAADAMLAHGVSRAAFREYRRSCRDLLGDHSYGVAVRRLMLWGAPAVVDPMIDVGKTDPLMYDALFDPVSGHDSYRNIIRRSLKPRLVRKVAARVFGGVRRHRARRARRMTDVAVRRMTERDIDEVLRVSGEIRGRPQAAYYASLCDSYVRRTPDTCLVAEHAGRVVGFLLADVRGWEFGQRLAGWLEVIGVEPAYQGRGVSRALLDELFESFRRAHVSVVNTMVDWNDGELIDYFRAQGFERGDYVNLVRTLGEAEG